MYKQNYNWDWLFQVFVFLKVIAELQLNLVSVHTKLLSHLTAYLCISYLKDKLCIHYTLRYSFLYVKYFFIWFVCSGLYQELMFLRIRCNYQMYVYVILLLHIKYKNCPFLSTRIEWNGRKRGKGRAFCKTRESFFPYLKWIFSFLCTNLLSFISLNH